MVGMLALGGIIVTAFLVLVVLGLAALVIKGVLLLIFLPLRLLFGIVLFPFRLARGLVGLVLLPVILLAGGLVAVVAIVGGFFALALPLLPLAALVFVVWLLTRASRKPVSL